MTIDLQSFKDAYYNGLRAFLAGGGEAVVNIVPVFEGDSLHAVHENVDKFMATLRVRRTHLAATDFEEAVNLCSTYSVNFLECVGVNGVHFAVIMVGGQPMLKPDFPHNIYKAFSYNLIQMELMN